MGCAWTAPVPGCRGLVIRVPRDASLHVACGLCLLLVELVNGLRYRFVRKDHVTKFPLHKMVQTLAIGLEKQKDQPTPSKALPKLSLSLSFSRGPHKVCGRGTRCPQPLYHGGNPITGAPSLEGSPSRRTKKVHSDLLSSSLSGQSAPKLSQALTAWRRTRRTGKAGFPLSVDQSHVYTLSASCTLSQHLSAKEHATCTWRSLAHGRLLWWAAKNTFRDSQREVGSCHQRP